MRTIHVIGVIAIASCFASPFSTVVSAQPSTQPTTAPAAPRVVENDPGKALIRKIVETHGGATSLTTVTSVRVTIDSETTKQSAVVRKIHLITTIAFPDRLRQESTLLAAGVNAKPNSSLVVVSPDGAWVLGTGGPPSIGVQALPPQGRDTYTKSLTMNIVNVLRVADSGTLHFAAAGTETVGAIEATQLDITGPNESKFRWLVDAKTGDVLARIDPTARSTYLEWESIDGLRLPTHSQTINAQRGEMTDVHTKYEINPTIDAHAFEKPPEPAPSTTQPTGQPTTQPTGQPK